MASAKRGRLGIGLLAAIAAGALRPAPIIAPILRGGRSIDGEWLTIGSGVASFLIPVSDASQGEASVANYTAPKFDNLACSRSLHAGRSRSEPAAAKAAPLVTPGARLMIALLLSLALWGAIWLGVSRFASLWN